jgi:hypothetical protein
LEENTNNNFGEENKVESTPMPVKKSKTNNWKISTFVLGLLLILSLAFGNLSLISISGNAVANDAVDFINTELLQGQAEATLEDTQSEKGIVATISIMGQETPVFITNDGETMYLQAIPLKEALPTDNQQEAPAQEAPVATVSVKSDKPTVELFIMSHCPYGTQVEKGILPVTKTLGDKIDFDLKFVYYAMHGEKEAYEQLNQYCIQKEQEDKLSEYLYCFLGSTSGSEAEGAACLDEVGVDKDMLATCFASANTEFDVDVNLADTASWLSGRYPLFDVDKVDNEKYAVGGSPTLVINGESVNSGRDSASLLKAICSSFNVAPEECNTVFEEGSPSPGFGWETSAQNNAAAAGCGV